MDLDTDKIDDAVMALLMLGASGKRAWRGIDQDAVRRLHERGLIERPDRKSPTIEFTDGGLARARRLVGELFGREGGGA